MSIFALVDRISPCYAWVETCLVSSSNIRLHANDRTHKTETINPFLITSDDSLHEAWVMVCTVQHVLSDFLAELLLLVHRHSLRAQTFRWDGMYWCWDYSHFVSHFLVCYTTVFQDYSQNLLNRFLVSVFGCLAWTRLALRWSVVMSKAIPLLDLSFVHVLFL